VKSKFLKSIVVVAIGALILGGIFYAKNRKGVSPELPTSTETAKSEDPSAAGIVTDAQDGQKTAAGADAGAKPAAPQVASGTSEMEVGATDKKAPECFQVTYTSRDVEERIKDNAFAFQKNLLKLPEVAFNPATVCVRVDGKPVRFETQKGKPSEVVIAPLKNIKSVVTASYCLGDSKCQESCKAPADQQVVVKPKDEFLDAIGGDSDSDLAKEYGKWDTEDGNAHNAKLEAALDPEIRREIAALDEEESKPKKAARKLETFSGWERSDESPACRSNDAGQKKAARNHKKESSS
jgi:hypothetical protein